MTTFDEYLKKFIDKLQQAGIEKTGEKKLPYGIQLLLVSGEERITANVYNGKKGISVVVGGTSTLKQTVESIVSGAPVQAIPILSEDENSNYNPPGFEHIANFDNCWIGTDESGKGDFFGPLVAAGVRVDADSAKLLSSAGIRDSKTLTDQKARALAAKIREICSGRFVELEITPARYNTLYNQFKAEGKNLNHLLAWAHARVLEDLLEKAPCNFALADKFADEKFIKSRLMAKGREITLVQTPKAERNIAVAAASVLARDRFLSRMDDMSARFGLKFPKGASVQVVEAAKIFVAKTNKAQLAEVAKLHFKTVDQI